MTSISSPIKGIAKGLLSEEVPMLAVVAVMVAPAAMLTGYQRTSRQE
jgi:hypothetical protein